MNDHERVTLEEGAEQGTLDSAGTQHQSGIVPPWRKQSPAQSAPPALKSLQQQQLQQQSALKQPFAAVKQPGKIGFFIKPQLPKSKQVQAAVPAYVKVEDSKPAQTRVQGLCPLLLLHTLFSTGNQLRKLFDMHAAF